VKKLEINMKFYELVQNNSGGSFAVNDDVTHRILVEAGEYKEAISIFESLGVYWNGVEEGMDCECCGDRWYSPSEINFPYNYGGFKKSNAESIAERYGASVIKRTQYSGNREFDVVFDTPESYMQYLADEYGWSKPDGYIYYKTDGFSLRKVSIYKNKKN
jgi:hypothetical protein